MVEEEEQEEGEREGAVCMSAESTIVEGGRQEEEEQVDEFASTFSFVLSTVDLHTLLFGNNRTVQS